MRIRAWKRYLTALGICCSGQLAAAQTRLPPPTPALPPAAFQAVDPYQNPGIYSWTPPLAVSSGAVVSSSWQEPLPPDGGVTAPAPVWTNGEFCEQDVCGPPCFRPCWYVGAAGLVFSRSDSNYDQLSFDDTDLIGDVLNTHTAVGDSAGGAQIWLGRYLSECTALEATYWGLYPNSNEATVFSNNLAGNLNTVFDLLPLEINGTNVNDLYDGAAAHRVRRDYEVHNVELNLLSGNLPGYRAQGLNFSYLAGLRYLRFNESFEYASADTVPIFGADLSNEAYYDIGVENDLFGFQVGGRLDWYWTPALSFYLMPKFGIYGNRMSQHSRIYNLDGTAVVGAGNPLAGELFDIESDKTYTSFLGEGDLGMSYRFAQRWVATAGFRVVAVSGVALATEQIPNNFADLPGVADIDGSSTLVLYGGYFGLGYSW